MAGTVTADALAAYLGVDCADDAMVSANLAMACAAANAWLAGALGEGADLSDPRALALGLAAAADVYDERSFEGGGSAKASGALRRMVADLSAQLRLEALAGEGA